MTTERAQHLNLAESTSWRLHWLVCALLEAGRDMKTAHFGGSVAELRTGPFSNLLERVKQAEASYQRLRWETQTMLGLDYDSDVEPLFESLPKTAEFLTELQTAKDNLHRVAVRALENETRTLRESIQHLGNALR